MFDWTSPSPPPCPHPVASDIDQHPWLLAAVSVWVTCEGFCDCVESSCICYKWATGTCDGGQSSTCLFLREFTEFTNLTETTEFTGFKLAQKGKTKIHRFHGKNTKFTEFTISKVSTV